MRIDYAGRARAFVGTRFRPQGRGEGGLDCVGLVLSTFEISPSLVRRDYRMRGNHRREIENGMSGEFRPVAFDQAKPGDVMLMLVASDQLHLGIRTPVGFVHAHAGIGRIVETPGLPEWPVVAVYRKRSRSRKG
jgi:lipoprotein Spr